MKTGAIVAAVALPLLAWGVLGWYAFLVLSRSRNRQDAFRDMRKGERLSETPAMRRAATWRPS